MRLAACISCIERSHSITRVGDNYGENDGTTGRYARRKSQGKTTHGWRALHSGAHDDRSIAVSILLKNYNHVTVICQGLHRLHFHFRRNQPKYNRFDSSEEL